MFVRTEEVIRTLRVMCWRVDYLSGGVQSAYHHRWWLQHIPDRSRVEIDHQGLKLATEVSHCLHSIVLSITGSCSRCRLTSSYRQMEA